MSNFSDGNSFNDILNRCLDRVDSSLDKRQGSIIYDALAPACAELAQCYIALDVYTDQTYLLTATGENLDKRVADYGLSRYPATYTEKLITIYNTDNELMDVDINTRFSIPNEYGGYVYQLVEHQSLGKYIGRCETPGTAGNAYSGHLLPLTSINGLGNVRITTTYKPGEDEEPDDSLRSRALNKINQEAFAGNKSAYVNMVNNIDGVTQCQVFPVWNGGGTVKIVIVGAGNTIPSANFVNEVQTMIDPVANHGEGIGLAPIGHTVTIAAPTSYRPQIYARIILKPGYIFSQVTTEVENSVDKYMHEVQNSWAESSSIVIYRAKIIAAILSVPAVENVSTLKIDEQDADVNIPITAENPSFLAYWNIAISAPVN